MPSRSAYCFAPATASEPAGSSTLRVSWNTSLIAAQSASVSTVQHVVEIFAAQPERFLADEFHRRAVREQADFRSA